MMRLAHFVLAFGFLTLGMGCGSDSGEQLDLAPVSGTVTQGGAPLPNALVTFHIDSGRPATGRTDESGKFTLMTKEPGDGAMVGSHKVTVMADTSVSEEVTSEDAYAVPDADAEGAIPVKYANPNTSGLTAEVTADGENNFTFDLEK